MQIGIPKEIKAGETRIAVSPNGVRVLVRRGHKVTLQRSAGRASGWSDPQYRKAGAVITSSLEKVYRAAELICKVKEPQARELRLLKSGQILFSFLHLAGNPQLASALRDKGVQVTAFELIQNKNGDRPLLNPMSQVAGEVAIKLGATCFPHSALTGKIVTVIGCGHVGRAALARAYQLGAVIRAVDKNQQVLRQLKRRYGRRLKTYPATKREIRKALSETDLLIGAVLIPGRRAPIVVTEAMVGAMKEGSVIVDVAIDEGGCVATSRPTSIKKPFFKRYGVFHCAIPNLPALAPRTASPALAKAVLPYLKRLAGGVSCLKV